MKTKYVELFENFKLNEDHWAGAESEVVYDRDGCKLIHCMNHIACMEYGEGTDWEFSVADEKKAKESFDNYHFDGWEFFILQCFDDGEVEDRFAIALSPFDDQIFVYDEDNKELDHDEYPDVVQDALKEIGEYVFTDSEGNSSKFAELAKQAYLALIDSGIEGDEITPSDVASKMVELAE